MTKYGFEFEQCYACKAFYCVLNSDPLENLIAWKSVLRPTNLHMLQFYSNECESLLQEENAKSILFEPFEHNL